MKRILREGGFLISKINQVSGRIFNKKLQQHNITDLNSAQGRILFSLWKVSEQTISSLSKQTALSKTSLTSMLQRLEELGHISRCAGEQDKRETIITLTAKSKALRQEYDEVSAEMNGLFYKGLQQDEIVAFEKVLHHILKNLTKYEEDEK